MKAEELMIGDWVMDTRSNTPLRVNPFLAQLEVPEWDPIPLTPEILEKNGWHKEVDKLEYMAKYDLNQNGKNCWMIWAINEHNLDIQRQPDDMKYNLCVHHIVIPCDYVHQLQHALRLCGINLEIKL